MAKTELKRGCSIAVERATDGSPQISVNRNRWFKFNHVFDCTDTQRDIFETCVQAKVKRLLDGYNVTILAYGQTGSGKTYTMDTACSGVLDDDNKGVIPRSVECIFRDIELLKHEYDFSVSCTFVELYLEHSFDLFSPRKSPLEMHEWENRILMPGLTQLEVSSAEEVTKHLIWGSAKRTVASTAMSKKSSRSHAIFTITIVARKLGGEGANSVTTSMFNLVDLAGSERCTKTLTRGDRFKEGVNINKSLLALGNVLNALGTTKAPPGHVSYRQSKLTRLLQQSLGGNSITLMIACVSCSNYNVAETLSTLRYANRTLQIKNRPVINMIPPVNEFEQQRGELQDTQESEQKSSTEPDTLAATEALQSADDDGIVETLMEQVDEIKIAYEELQLHSQEARPQLNDGRGDEEPAPQLLLHFQPEMPTSKQLELIDDLRRHNQTLEQKQLLYDFVCCNYSEREDNDEEAGADLLASGNNLLNELRKNTSAKSVEDQPKQLQLLHEQITQHLSQANELMMRKEDRKSLNELNAEINAINESKWKIIKQYRQLKLESNVQVIPSESKDLETKSKPKGKTKGKVKGKKMRKCAEAQATSKPPSEAAEGQLSTQSQVKTIDQSDASNWIDNELNVILSLVGAEQDMEDRQAITKEQKQEKSIAHLDNLQQKEGIKDLDNRLRCFTSKNIYELEEIHQKTLNALVLQQRQQAAWKKEQKDRAEKQSSLLQEKDQQINALTKQLSQANEDKEELLQRVNLLLSCQEAPQLMDPHFNENSEESGDKRNKNEELCQPTGSEEQASSRNCIEGSEDLPVSTSLAKDHGDTAST